MTYFPPTGAHEDSEPQLNKVSAAPSDSLNDTLNDSLAEPLASAFAAALAGSPAENLFHRMSCLLQCPIDTPNLWKKVLAAMGETLGCSTLQLVWAEPMIASPIYQWGEGQPPSVGSGRALWEHLAIPETSLAETLWSSQASDLQSQLSVLVAEGYFQLSGGRVYAADSWPPELLAMFGFEGRRHLLLLPLCHQQQISATAKEDYLDQDCIGVLVLMRSVDVPLWSDVDVRCVEMAGAQMYLAVQRSRVERLFRSCSARDQLTQLPDRLLFNQQLTRSIAISKEKDVMLGVAFLDLDRFKNINDTLGHAAGDCLLKQVAARLRGCLRGYDVVARWGGDEFTLLLSDLRSPEQITNIAERILQRLSAPFHVQGEDLYVTASLGIALAPYDGDDEQTLLCNADAAMYQAKAKGRNNYQVYFEEINANARTQLNLETDLRKALDNQELFLCYQPQVDLRSGQWIGMEALIRWQHPTLGMIAPGKFISIAEETGLIEPIGRWVLRTACAQYCQWHKAGLPALRLAVNLSAQQFHRSNLLRSVMEVIRSTGFDARYLELEVTESAAMQDVKLAIDVLKKFSLAGIQIAMDDFGTGYSSLSVLKYFPLDTIKIDRSFVKDLVESPSDAAIASTIIALAKGLNFKVLAEGIETPEQMNVLNEMGCDYAQGYWFSRPLTVQQVDDMLASGKF
ncbi:MAG: putative bifunctional diguanylate cyclase/phosphodiesterase [Phormidesmis sp.]